jgi:hypothetical protein
MGTSGKINVGPYQGVIKPRPPFTVHVFVLPPFLIFFDVKPKSS